MPLTLTGKEACTQALSDARLTFKISLRIDRSELQKVWSLSEMKQGAVLRTYKIFGIHNECQGAEDYHEMKEEIAFHP